MTKFKKNFRCVSPWREMFRNFSFVSELELVSYTNREWIAAPGWWNDDVFFEADIFRSKND
jgi:hypothetical protein